MFYLTNSRYTEYNTNVVYITHFAFQHLYNYKYYKYYNNSIIIIFTGYGYDYRPTLLNEVNCGTDELVLLQCSLSTFITSTCRRHSMDVSVSCCKLGNSDYL